MRRNSMDFAWNQHTRLDIDYVYRNCGCSCGPNDQTKTICLDPCGKVTVGENQRTPSQVTSEGRIHDLVLAAGGQKMIVTPSLVGQRGTRLFTDVW